MRDLRQRLAELRASCQRATGRPFTNFLCPILYEDEDVELCRGHVVNRSFPESARAWTVQRKDVDGFYGTHFEADFVDLLYKEGGSVEEVIGNPSLLRRYRPKITVDDEPVEYYLDTGDVSPDHTRVALPGGAQLGLKITPADMSRTDDATWGLTIEKNLRLCSTVSLIKSAYLTLFALHGYSYAVTTGGRFVGRTILGDFFSQSTGKHKRQVQEAAREHFRPFIHMVRPVLESGDLQGTISDQLVSACVVENGRVWALIVYVRTSTLMHAVLLPSASTNLELAHFLEFLDGDSGTIVSSLCRCNTVELSRVSSPTKLEWPKFPTESIEW